MSDPVGGGDAPTPATGLTLALAKQHLEYDDGDRDQLILQSMDAAADWVEDYTGLLLTRRSVACLRRAAAAIDIGVGPTPVIDGVSYIDAGGAVQMVDPAQYRLVGQRLHMAGALPIAPYGIEISVTAGFDGVVPAKLIRAQLMLIAHWHMHREGTSERGAEEVPFGVIDLCRSFRRQLV